jgi:peptidoglycan/xylan/chitin deacetylase (PgdA/CDA1 family)
MISIVIPVLNEEKFLPDCLRSLRAQDYQGEYEIIVADNGSGDSSAAVAAKLGARVIVCPEEKGVFYARQLGADAARGDIIVQADADTIYPRDWLRRIAEKLDAHPEAVAVAGRFLYRDAPWWARFEYFLRRGANRFTTAFLGRPMVISGATFAFRRRAFLSVNGYRGLAYAPDQYGIASRLSRLGRIIYDKDLYVLTSARSVQKPVLVLIKDLLAHLLRWAVQLGWGRLKAIPGTGLKIPRRRVAWLLPVAALIISLITYGYFIPTSPVFGKVYYEAKSQDKVVALTFDDGPNEPYTSQILNILSSYDIKATFFLIGKNVELEPETARRILADGHVIGNHSYSHSTNHALTEYSARDLAHAQEVIEGTLGIVPHLYRPPHGRKSPWELQAVKKEGMLVVTWSVSANDQHVIAFLGKPSPQNFAREIVSRTHPGEIILLHDGYGTRHNTPQADQSLTVSALPLIIEKLKAEGYRFVTVPELLKVPAYGEALP